MTTSLALERLCNTTLAILDFVQRSTDAIDDGNISLGIFLDLSKAFDSVSHSILLDKLSDYILNKNTLRWFENYLKDCKQYVCIDGINSCSRTISYGVPQGSILGPVLFLIYMNDTQLSYQNNPFITLCRLYESFMQP